MVGVLNGGIVTNSSLTKPIYVDFANGVKISDKTIIFGGIVGLQNSGRIENSYILADRIEFASGNRLPLWLIGMIY